MVLADSNSTEVPKAPKASLQPNPGSAPSLTPRTSCPPPPLPTVCEGASKGTCYSFSLLCAAA